MMYCTDAQYSPIRVSIYATCDMADEVAASILEYGFREDSRTREHYSSNISSFVADYFDEDELNGEDVISFIGHSEFMSYINCECDDAEIRAFSILKHALPGSFVELLGPNRFDDDDGYEREAWRFEKVDAPEPTIEDISDMWDAAEVNGFGLVSQTGPLRWDVASFRSPFDNERLEQSGDE